MRRRVALRVATAALAGLGLATFALTAAVAGPPNEATVRFGEPELGSGLNDPGAGVFHDGSLHASDRIFPRTVVISEGGSVDFTVEGFHQVAICGAGDTFADVTIPAFPPNLFINDSDCPAAAAPLVDVTRTFNESGRYLILCNVTPHVTDLGMYSWVIVQ